MATAVVALFAVGCQAFSGDFAEFGGERVRDLRDRAALQDTMLQLRLDGLLQSSLRRAAVQCWLIVGDGPGFDPVAAHLGVQATRLEGKGALLLCDSGTGVDRLAVGHGLAANSAIYDVVDPGPEGGLSAALNERLQSFDPDAIAINRSADLAAADGLTASNEQWLAEKLAPEYLARLVSSAPLVESFLGTQLDVEAAPFVESARLTVAILDHVLSDQVVFAAGTSVLDLQWAVRDRAAALHVELAYVPRVFIYRPGQTLDAERRMEMDLILQPRDLVFVSAGIRYAGYANRSGRWAYLLPTGEKVAPPWADDLLSRLADAVQSSVARLRPGMSRAEARSTLDAGLAGMLEPFSSLDRVGRLSEGPTEPPLRSGAGDWGEDYRIAAETALVITVGAAVATAEVGGRRTSLWLLETAIVGADGGRFVVPLQRTPLLID